MDAPLYEFREGDCLEVMRGMATGSVDLTITSPPYEDARTYGIGFKLSGQGWVDWIAPRVVEMARVTNGLVIFNAAGKVKSFRYSPVVEWLVADLTRNYGLVCGPAPYVYSRVGIPGSGGPHYHRRDWEPIYAFARPECLPPKWSNNTATGHPPKWAPGGAMSHRLSDGTRTNQWGKTGRDTGTRQLEGGKAASGAGPRPSHVTTTKSFTARKQGGNDRKDETYTPPTLANSGNIIKVKVGGGQMGDELAHENEAPFSEKLPEFFILSYCPPGGLVLDPFAGSGTTIKAAVKHGRRGLGVDIRDGKGGLDTARRRLANLTPGI